MADSIRPLISIIVPVYNVAEFLPQCLDSLVGQTYEDIEILAIDDGSTDESGRILDEYAARDSRVRAVHIANGGVSNARNVGLDMARGDFVGFVDSDDWVDTDMYAQLAAAMTGDVDVVCGEYVRERATGPECDLILVNEPHIYNRAAAVVEIFSSLNSKRTAWAVWDKLFRKELVTNIRFDRTILHGEDMLFFYEAMRGCRQFALLPLYGYHYRMRESSMLHNRTTPGYLTVWRAYHRLWQWAATEPAALREAVTLMTLDIAIGIGRLMLIVDPERYEDDLRAIGHFLRPRLCLAVTHAPSLRMRLGAIYLSLPLPLIRALRALTR